MFAKVYASLWRGSLHGSGITWAVFVYLLAHADPKGIVEVLPAAIAADTGFSMDEVLRALAELEGPDPESKTPDQQGRRLERIDEHRSWGWLIVNYEKYRNYRDPDLTRAQTLERVRRHREKRNRGLGGPIRTKPDPEELVDQPPPEFVPLEGPVGPARHGGRRRAKREEESESFPAFWDSYPRKVGRRAAARAFVSALGRHADVDGDDLVAAAGAFAKRVKFENREERFVPHPTTWLNQDRFMEEFADDEKTQG